MEENTIKPASNATNNSPVYDWKVLTNFGVSFFFLIIGMHKLYVYKNEEYGEENLNAYVGGDAYNFIINTGYATAYFVLALIFVVIACTFLICNHLKTSK
ncbi:hypothetical protein [Sutcliffiella horikoshii]|uniref:hypothetical protein n=1 Tax=Sutcliffiella horikoshii TaxID=79883 RepID=UPI001CFEC760|nr:hypothetical protein [Sutcliffiella horikoshii]